MCAIRSRQAKRSEAPALLSLLSLVLCCLHALCTSHHASLSPLSTFLMSNPLHRALSCRSSGFATSLLTIFLSEAHPRLARSRPVLCALHLRHAGSVVSLRLHLLLLMLHLTDRVDIHKELEHRIADFHGTEDSILYGSCFDANGGTRSTKMCLLLCVCVHMRARVRVQCCGQHPQVSSRRSSARRMPS